MRIAVTGANGSIGRVVVDVLKRHSHEVVTAGSSAELNLEHPSDSLDAWVRESGANALVHLAGKKPPAPPEELFSSNVGATYSVLESVARISPGTHVIVASSAAAAGGPLTPYGASKFAAEAIARHFRERADMRITVARIFNVVGAPNDTTSFVPQFLAHLKAASEGARLEVRDADCVRDFINVEDVARAIVVLIEHGRDRSFTDIGTGVGTTVEALARGLLLHVGKTIDLRPVQSSGGGIRQSVAEVTALKELGWQPHVTGVRAVIDPTP